MANKKEGYIYIIKACWIELEDGYLLCNVLNSTNLCKMGISENWYIRTKQIENNVPFTMIPILVLHSNNIFKDDVFFKKLFDKKRLLGKKEWYNFLNKDIDLMKKMAIEYLNCDVVYDDIDDIRKL